MPWTHLDIFPNLQQPLPHVSNSSSSPWKYFSSLSLVGNSKEAAALEKGEEESDEAKESEADLTEVHIHHLLLHQLSSETGW